MIFKDQMNRTIRLEAIPERIVSLVPSQTELLFDLGLTDEVVGITKFCIHPEAWFRSKTRIGGTKTVNIEKVTALKPDLIIANKEENTKADIEALESIAPVWLSDIFTLEDAFQMMKQIGEICGKASEGNVLVDEISASFQELNRESNTQEKPLNVLYLIWKNPYLAAAKDTFIDDMLKRCGFQNFLSHETRYPEWTPDPKHIPDLILLSSEPYPFKEKHIAELQEMYPETRILLVDGEMFSWYGSRLKHAADYFKSLLVEIGG